MENIVNIALNLALNIKESIKDEKLEHFIRIKFLCESDGSYEIDELKKKYLTHKDFDKLRIIAVNILRLILYDLKNKKRENRKKLLI